MATLWKHLGPGLVAVLYVALALAEGGFDQKPLAVVTIVIWWVVAIGVFVRVWPGSRAPRAAIACGASLCALAVLSTLSLVWADDAGRAFEEVMRVGGYLGLFALTVLASRRGSSGSWAAGLAAGLGGVAVLALLARFEPGLLTEGLGDQGDVIPSAAGRLSFPIGYWNGLGAVMALAVVAILWQAVAAGDRRTRAVSVAALPLPLLALFLSQSLGGAIAAAIGLVVVFAVARERLPLAAALAVGGIGGALLVALADARSELVDGVAGATARAQGDEMLLIAVLVAIATGAAWYLLDGRARSLARVSLSMPRPVAIALALATLVAAVLVVDPVARWEDFKDPGTLAELPTEASTAEAEAVASAAGNGRYQWWTEGLDAWLGDPVTGVGAGNYELYWNANSTLPVAVQDAHSLFVETLAELGPLGLLAVLAFFATALAAGLGRRRSSRGETTVWLGILAAGIVTAAGEWTWEIPAAIAPLVIAAGVMTGPATLRPRWPRSVEAASGDVDPSERSWFGLGVATLLVGFASIWVAGVALLTTIQLDESRAAVDAGDLDAAARNATYAAAIQPWSPAPKLQLAQVEELRGRFDEARIAAEEAIDRSESDWRPWVVLARIRAADGDPEGAEEALARAGELSPLPLPTELDR